eukprot:366125-Chlamydomonas_euryale.AAC.4
MAKGSGGGSGCNCGARCGGVRITHSKDHSLGVGTVVGPCEQGSEQGAECPGPRPSSCVDGLSQDACARSRELDRLPGGASSEI